MFFDTHCHLNFQAFEGRVEGVVREANKAGVGLILVPGTEVASSTSAVKIANSFDGVYAAVGIHPHHVNQYQSAKIKDQKNFNLLSLGIQKDKNQQLNVLIQLLSEKKVVAIGEVGMDRHLYKKTKYTDYQIDHEFIASQKELLVFQIKLALEHDKSLIIHNWEAKKDTVEALFANWDTKLENRVVFHCCEPDKELLQIAIDRKIFIGVDGDITYNMAKSQFVADVPIDRLVLETDSPYLMPEPMRSRRASKEYNTPKNIPHIAQFLAQIRHVSIDLIASSTYENSCVLFRV